MVTCCRSPKRCEPEADALDPVVDPLLVVPEAVAPVEPVPAVEPVEPVPEVLPVVEPVPEVLPVVEPVPAGLPVVEPVGEPVPDGLPVVAPLVEPAAPPCAPAPSRVPVISTRWPTCCSSSRSRLPVSA